MIQTKPVVLIVDDDMEVANGLLAEYRQEGDDPLICQNPLEAEAIALRCMPQLIVISLTMSAMDGMLLALNIKRHPQLADVPIVFITGEIPSKEVSRLAFTVGGIDTVTKPIKHQQIKAIVAASSTDKTLCQLRRLAQKLSKGA